MKGAFVVPRQTDGMLAQLRRNGIVELIEAQGSTTVSELCRKFGVTSATIRSDLKKLEDAGALERTYGGAVRTPKAVSDPSIHQRETRQVPQKKAIALAALQHIRPNDVIGLDSGSTTFQLCRLLGRFEQLTVVTYDLQIAAWLEYNTSVNIIMAGGQVHRNYHCTCGRATRDALSILNLKKLFLSSNGVSIEQGLSTMSLDMAEIKSTLVKSAEAVYLLCDSTKMGRKAIVSFAPLSSVDALITDSGVSPEFKRQVEEAGVTVEVAHVPEEAD